MKCISEICKIFKDSCRKLPHKIKLKFYKNQSQVNVCLGCILLGVLLQEFRGMQINDTCSNIK